VVENNIAKGKCHELPALAQGATTETALVTEEPTEKMQNPIVSDGTPQYEECNMDYSDDEDDPRHHTEVEEYIAGTIRTILQPDRRTKGPQTRFRKRVDEATTIGHLLLCRIWTR
jgi:hypothetical protein